MNCRCAHHPASPTTCPVCGGRVVGRRPSQQITPEVVDRALRERPRGGSIRTEQDDYYDGGAW